MADYTLQILHASDLEGGVDAITRAPNFAAIVDALDDTYENTLILSAGDNYLPGPFFSAASDGALREPLQRAYEDYFNLPAGTLSNLREAGGRVDLSIMNFIGFEASALGNHEFDLGTGAIAEIIGPDIRGTTFADTRWLGAQFPYLSANLDFTNDGALSGLFTDQLLPSSAFFPLGTPNTLTETDLPDLQTAPKIAPSTILEEGGERIGIVGATTPLLASISSPGDVTVKDPGAGTNDMAALATLLQPVIDDLLAEGVNKVVLVTHLQQIALEKELIGLLSGVDVIIAGGSDTLLADDEDIARGLNPGDTPDETYPFVTTNKDGDPAIIVSTDGEYSYVGRLVLNFDEQGILDSSSIDANESGAFATTDAVVDELWGDRNPFADETKGELVKQLTDAVQTVVTTKDSNVFGRSDVFIEGRREEVRTQETNLGNLTADANLFVAQQIDDTVQVSIKNGGGIRAPIGVIENQGGTTLELPPLANPAANKEAGEVSQLDIENSLRFNNGLTLLTVTAEGLKAILEHGVAASGPGSTPGQFPQVGGLSFSYDVSRTARTVDDSGNVVDGGDRVRNLAILNDDGSVADVIVRNGEIVGDPSRAIRIVTLNFLASGGDNYPFPDLSSDRVDLVDDMASPSGVATFAADGSEQDALAEYLAANFPADEDASTPTFSREDTSPLQDNRIQNLQDRPDTVLAQTGPLTAMGTFQSEAGAEIVAHDPTSQRLFVTTGDTIEILDISQPNQPTLVKAIDITTLGGGINSVAVKNGVLAAAIEAEIAQGAGIVAFFDTDGNLIQSVTVGALPDMLTFSPDGQKVLVANEGEPNADYTVDPEGSISIINLSGGVENLTQDDVTTASFGGFNDQKQALIDKGVRIYGPNASVAQDLEPEYIAVAPNGTTAFVTLQENNAFAVVDLDEASDRYGEVLDILPLGYKDFSSEQSGSFGTTNTLDASDRDGGINLKNWPVLGMYQPDAIAAFEIEGKTYYITANEGDARDYDAFSEEVRIGDEEIVLDANTFPNATELKQADQLGRLRITNQLGDLDGDGDFDQLYAYGGRSFAIWDDQGNQVFDSGDQIARITAALTPGLFNADDGDPAEFDNRSDDKGAEPEAVTVGQVGDRLYAFIGLERSGGGVLLYDITNPVSPQFVQYINQTGDISPEGFKFIAAEDSPTGRPVLAVANEVSLTTTLYDIGGNGVQGTDIGETLEGNDADNLIFALGGNDLVAGGLGNDSIFGGDGNDILRGDLNRRDAQGDRNGGNDRIDGGAGNDRIGGKAGNDTLLGGDGNDQIWGDDGDDLIRGGRGNDRIYGDNRQGAQGSDIFVLAMSEGRDLIFDFEVGIDKIGLANGLTFGALSIQSQGKNTLISAGGEDLALLQVKAEDLISAADTAFLVV